MQQINLEDLFGGGENEVCGMTCPKGQSLIKKAGYKAIFNGCGPSGEFNHISDKIGFTNCCNEHDICYTDCSKSKEQCDSEFTECLNGHCKTKKKKEKDECSTTATMFSWGVNAFGCDAYTKSIQEACECKSTKHDEL
ncbi:predicted protein [Naegleria gruberi]|uniref:Predicted protein n=1 Tax=Naegleria gruberi TaxID=5762 RepID=D2W1P8_NAEGR|nr:uncharacterized protein NAEGRDRAFT_75332 [Naegleria gruberi]EFC37002.1 predicted protein [Naegleria gruberi]|eukprot:XP_002669746.1 predicted protein [Naegleria gruberi strain NEG-M]